MLRNNESLCPCSRRGGLCDRCFECPGCLDGRVRDAAGERRAAQRVSRAPRRRSACSSARSRARRRGPSSRSTTASLTTITPNSTTSEFDGVGCNSSTLCFAAGTDFSPTHPGPARGVVQRDVVLGVDLRGPGQLDVLRARRHGLPRLDLVLLGRPVHDLDLRPTPLIEHWTGSSWGIQSMTLPSGTINATLSDVSCTSTTACTAVGTYTTSTRTSALIERYNGTSWTFQTDGRSRPAPSQLELDGVSCTTSTACVAVGNYTDSSAVQHALAEHWNGTAWSQRTVAGPERRDQRGPVRRLLLHDQSAPAASPSAATPTAAASSSPRPPATTARPGRCSRSRGPAISSNATLNGVSCTSSTFCLAVGAAVTTATGVVGPVVVQGPVGPSRTP